MHNYIKRVIPLTIIVCMLCACSNGVSDDSDSLENDYYEHNESIEKYELFISDDKSFAIQLPEHSYIIQEDDHMLCQANTDEIFTFTLGWGTDDLTKRYTSIEELKAGLENDGVNLFANIISFESIYEGTSYKGYKYITHSSGDVGRTICYYVNYFDKGNSYGFTFQLSNQDFINVADDIMDSFYIFDDER